VIKLRYPGVEDAVDADLTQLRRVLSLSRLFPLDGPAMDRLMEEVRQRFRDETDYVTELGHLQYMREHAVTSGIVYPAPVEALCGPGVLVLSEEPGADLDTARHWPQAQRDALARVLSRWLVHQVFVARAVHADPHPGNFAFRDDGRVVVYDFGCVKRVPAPVVQRVRQLIGAFARRDWPQVHQALDDLGGFAGAVPLEAIEPLYKDLDRLLVRPLTASGGFDFRDADFIPALRAAGRAHLGLSLKFKPVTDLVFVMRALSGHYWLLRALGAQVDVRSLLLAVALEVPDGGP
jgi:predicted unusual protein kinase regulating ubiquinone biosynthesis (AarF/ABC1/UbiB family)